MLCIKTQKISNALNINNNKILTWKFVKIICPNHAVKLGPDHNELNNIISKNGININENISFEFY